MENPPLRLMAAAKYFDISLSAIVEHLLSKGVNINDLKPTSKLTDEMFLTLQDKFGPKRAGVKQAVSLIEECLNGNLPDLDLGNSGLTSVDFYESLLNAALSRCAHITTLILSNEWWVWDTEANWWTLKHSRNSGPENYLTILPDALKHLKNLTTLICCGEMGNNWLINDIELVSGLTKLKHLDLRDNRITSVKALKKLTALENLHINRNNIQNLEGLENLKSLSHLDIHTNQIEDIKKINELVSLKKIDLQNNKIRAISGLGHLALLDDIRLNKNEITDIKGLEFLLDRGNELYIEIDENPFVRKYQLRLLSGENHASFLREILLRQMDSSKRGTCVYPVKILMLGNHASGKSSLVDFLINKKSNGSTHILRIENYFLSTGSPKKILPDGIFFDFGGQDFYHGLYQAFISSNALQIVVFDGKKDKNETGVDRHGIPIVNYNRQYWLGQKNYQERNSKDSDPYIVIQSFADDAINESRPIEYDSYRGYKKSFFLSLADNLTEDQRIDSTFYAAGREYFKAYLNGLLKKIQHSEEEPDWYIKFLNFVIAKEDKSHAPLTLTEVLPHYNVKDLPDDEKLESLKTNLITLHRHGLVMYYHRIEQLGNIVWLNPSELVRHIQETILNKTFADGKRHQRPGIISKTEFEKIVADDKILSLLKEQKVIFLHNPTGLQENEEYIIPNYLPLIDNEGTESQLFTFGLNKPSFIVKFNDFIPFGLINQMICLFGKQPDIKKFWRNQLLFTFNKDARILIELDFEQLSIKVHMQMLKHSAANEKNITEYLFFCIMALYWNLKNEDIITYDEFLNYKEQIDNKADLNINDKNRNWWALKTERQFIPTDAYLSVDEQRYTSCTELFDLPDKEYIVSSYGIKDGRINDRDVMEISIGPLEQFTRKRNSSMKKVFVSYSKYDEDYLQDFEDHLVTLKQEGVATFNCKKIEFGKEWDEEIKKQIDQCDIMICLISVKFLNTDYITKIEIPKAIEQGKIIVPIIIKACDWENSVLGKYQAAQRGKVVSLDNNLRLVGQIKGYTAEEKAAFWTEIVKEFRNKLLFS